MGRMSPAQLRRAKIDALKLLIAFAYSVKHRLRGEYGTDYEDYDGVLPRSIVRYEETGFSTDNSSPIHGSESYNATGTLAPKVKQKDDGSGSDDSQSSSVLKHSRSISKPSSMHFHSASVALSESSAATPLLSDNHRTVQFHPQATIEKTPLPLV